MMNIPRCMQGQMKVAETFVCGECSAKSPTADVGGIRVMKGDDNLLERPELLCAKCASEAFSDAGMFIKDGQPVNDARVEFLLLDMYPGEINIFVRVKAE